MWSLELFRTVDGLRLMELPVVPFTWSTSVRDSSMDGDPDNLSSEEFSGLTFSYDALATVMSLSGSDWQNRVLSTFTPTKHGIMALWNGVPVVGGPINPTVEIDRTGVKVTIDSYWDILARRYMVSETEYSAHRQIAATDRQLYSIASHILQTVMNKPSGALPLVLPGWAYGSHTRTWQGFNVVNLGATKLLEEIANVVNGPDLVLRPRVNGQKFEWVLVHGTDTNPHIGQDTLHDWEELSQWAGELTATLSSAYVAHRVYAVGDGSDVGTHIARRDSGVPAEWPLLELVVSDSSITAESDTDSSRLNAFADGNLNAHPVIGLRLSVDGNGATQLGQFWPGELARVTTRGNPALADGSYDLRILSMSGSDSSVVTLEFDPMVLEVL